MKKYKNTIKLNEILDRNMPFCPVYLLFKNSLIFYLERYNGKLTESA